MKRIANFNPGSVTLSLLYKNTIETTYENFEVIIYY